MAHATIFELSGRIGCGVCHSVQDRRAGLQFHDFFGREATCVCSTTISNVNDHVAATVPWLRYCPICYVQSEAAIRNKVVLGRQSIGSLLGDDGGSFGPDGTMDGRNKRGNLY